MSTTADEPAATGRPPERAPVEVAEPGDAAPPAPSARPRRGFGSVSDMVRSMAVVLAFVLVILWLTPRPRTDPVRVIDYTGPLQQARQTAPYDVYAPYALDPAWRATSARTERSAEGALMWHLGFVTPGGQYAAVEQSDGPVETAVRRFSGGAPSVGSTDVAGATWERREDAKGRTLWRRVDGAMVAVTGTAAWPELEQLAGSLRPE